MPISDLDAAVAHGSQLLCCLTRTTRKSSEADTVACSVFSLAQCHATAKVSNDEAEDIMMAEIRSRAEYGARRHCRELVSRRKLPFCQTLRRNGLTFYNLHLTVCKKVGVKLDSPCFLGFVCNIIRICHSSYATCHRFAKCVVKDLTELRLS